MASVRTEYRVVASRLKALLRKQKVTYRELARELQLSESGLKKVLNANDGSFLRLTEICRVLGVSLSDVLQASDEQLVDVRFSAKQQAMLMDDPLTFSVYWALVYERRSATDTANVLKISERKLFSILRKLDEAKLLLLLPGGRVRVPPIQLVRWVPRGPLVEKVYKEWSRALLDDSLRDHFVNDGDSANDEVRAKSFFLLRYFRVKEQTYQDLLRAHRDLEGEFIRRATADMRSEDPDLIHLRWLSAVSSGSFLKTSKR